MSGHDKPDFKTREVHAGVTPDPVTGAILTPIYQTTTYVQESVDQYLAKGYSYSRSGNRKGSNRMKKSRRRFWQYSSVSENSCSSTCRPWASKIR